MAPEPFVVLLICAERERAGNLAALIGATGHRVVATPYGPAALARASDAHLIVVDRVDGPVSAPLVVSRIKAALNLQDIPLLAIAQTDDANDRVALLEAGADGVMAHPVDAGELAARIDGLLVRTPQAVTGVPSAPALTELVRTGPRVIGFFSPKGGAGVTTIAVNCAVALASRGGRSVALVDLDLGWGQVATHLNMTPRLTVVELARDTVALQDPELVRGYAERHSSGLAVFGAPQRPDLSELVTQDLVTGLLAGIVAAFDLVLVDCGSVLDERALTLFELCQRLVLVVTPEIPAVRSMHALLEMISEEEGRSDRQFFVVNHLFAEEMLRPDDLQRSLQAPIQAELPYDASLYLRAVNEGVPVVLGSPRTLPAERLTKIAFQLVGETPEAVHQAADGQRRLRLAGLLRRG